MSKPRHRNGATPLPARPRPPRTWLALLPLHVQIAYTIAVAGAVAAGFTLLVTALLANRLVVVAAFVAVCGGAFYVAVRQHVHAYAGAYRTFRNHVLAVDDSPALRASMRRHPAGSGVERVGSERLRPVPAVATLRSWP